MSNGPVAEPLANGGIGETDAPEIGVKPGDVLAGKYAVERVLGVGGMGVVVAAHHVQLDTKVAIKFLLPGMLRNPEAVTRFAREARAAVKITSEHVARVLDVGTLATGAPYMVMEYLEGGDLAAWLQQRGPLPFEQAVEFILQACVALAEAHSLGMVHRDLKPANLFCVRRPDGQHLVKVLDFGISKVLEAPGMSVTKTSALMGSPLYMSPEQMHSSKDADAQSDIWALGVILYELVTGRVPFAGESVTEVAIKVATQTAPPPRSFRADLPAGLEAVILKCLEKPRQSRYANVAELALQLGEFAPKRAHTSIDRIVGTLHAAGSSGGEAAMPPPFQPPSMAVSGGTMVPVGQTAPGTPGVKSRGGLVAGLALAGVLAIGGGVAVFARAPAAARPAGAVGLSGPAGSAASLRPDEPPQEPSQAAAPAVDAARAPVHGAAPTRLTALPPLAAQASPSPRPVAAVPASGVPIVAPSSATTAPTVLPTSSSPNAAASAPPSTTPAAPPAAPAPIAPIAPIAQGCDPPYTLDDQGRKHFKTECFAKK